MTLEECTKSELIRIVNEVAKSDTNVDYKIERTLDNIARERDAKRRNEIEKLSVYASEKRQEYLDFFKPYIGKSYDDIPAEILEKAVSCINEARRADIKRNKLLANIRDREYEATDDPWISVHDRLPKSGEDILYINTDEQVFIGFYDRHEKRFTGARVGLVSLGEVTHWMPQPTSPKGDHYGTLESL